MTLLYNLKIRNGSNHYQEARQKLQFASGEADHVHLHKVTTLNMVEASSSPDYSQAIDSSSLLSFSIIETVSFMHDYDFTVKPV